MRRLVVMFVVCVLTAPAVWSGELAGVTMADESMAGESALILNGMGLRKKLWVKVYVAGLYLETETDDAERALNQNGPKRVVMHFLTDKVTDKKLDAAWFEGFEANSPSTYGDLEARVRRFADLFGDMKTGDVIELTMIPNEGTAVALNGEELAVIEGDDFSTALLRVWLGEHPPTSDLQVGMLGG